MRQKINFLRHCELSIFCVRASCTTLLKYVLHLQKKNTLLQYTFWSMELHILIPFFNYNNKVYFCPYINQSTFGIVLNGIILVLGILDIFRKVFSQRIFPRATPKVKISRVAISQAATSQRLGKAFWNAAGCNEGRALRLGWATGQSSATRTG